MDEDFVDKAEELDVKVRDGGRGSRGGRGMRGNGARGGRGGCRGGGGMSREVVISKALSKLLRHAAEEAGLKLDAEGYAQLDEVVSHRTSSDLGHRARASKTSSLYSITCSTRAFYKCSEH